jgi:hypothetical protein
MSLFLQAEAPSRVEKKVSFITFKGKDYHITIETIDRDRAHYYLELNIRNRPLNQLTVGKYADLYRSRQWILNGEAIVIDDQGRLVNGQHRLEACVQSGQSFDSFVIRGVDPEAFKTYDRPRMRRTQDVLSIECFEHNSALAAVASTVWFWERGRILSQYPTPEPTELLDLCKLRPQLQASAAIGASSRKILPASIAGSCHYLFSCLDLDDANQFFEQFVSGTGLESGSPILVLRERLIADKASKAKLSTVYRMALVIKAWNAWRHGKPMKALRVRLDGDSPEPFPTPE